MPTTSLCSRSFEQIAPGDQASLAHTLSTDLADGLRAAAAPALAAQWAGVLLTRLIEGQLPGPGSRIDRLSLRFAGSAHIGQTVTAQVTVRDKGADGWLRLDCHIVGPQGQPLVQGEAEVLAPLQAVCVPCEHAPPPPGARLQALVERARGLLAGQPLRVAVVHPVSAVAVAGAAEAAREGLIEPVWVGPQARILAAAKEAGVELSAANIVATEHSHAAADAAVELARAGKVEALMKGAGHTDELLHAVFDPRAGLRTGRRASHVFVIDAPAAARLLLITDAAVNIAPDLNTKRDIAQNAIDLAHALGIATPRMAILAAVETVNADMPATLDAAALCKMAQRQQITGGILDGPLAFDNAISAAAAHTKGIDSPVAGRADILLTPDLESGNMLAKQLEYLGGAVIAGIVVGTRVPVILTSRADDAQARQASCALAVLLRHAQQAALAKADTPPAAAN